MKLKIRNIKWTLLIIATTLFSCNFSLRDKKHVDNTKQKNIKSEGESLLVFEKQKYNFGKISSKNKVSTIFEFTNKGKTTLIVSKVDVSCGCTVTDWLKRPVENGKNGYVKVIFDPKGRKGMFNKSIYVKSNAVNDVELLKIEGEIVEN